MAQYSEQDLILLNSYLDGRLTPAERAALETRLAGDAALRSEFESLRETVGLLRMAERVPIPRSFTLDPATAARLARPSLWDRLGLTSVPGWALAGASLVVVALCVGALIAGGGLGGSPTSVAQAPAAAAIRAGVPAATEAPAEMFAAPTEAGTELVPYAAAPAGTQLPAPTEAPAGASIGAASKSAGQTPMGLGGGPPPAGAGGASGGPGSSDAGAYPTQPPRPTQAAAPLAPQAALTAPGAESAAQSGGAANTASDQANLAATATESGLRNQTSAPLFATIEVTEANPLENLTGSSWSILLGGTALLIVVVMVVTLLMRRRQ